MQENNNVHGFTFLELVIVIAILAIIVTIVVPNFKLVLPGQRRKEFISHLNALMQITWQDSLVTHKLHKVVFDFTKRTVSIETDSGKKSPNSEQIFEPMKSPYLNTTYVWPEDTFDLKNFYIGSVDEVSSTLRGEKGKVWFFVVPEGFTQAVIINMLDLQDVTDEQRPREFSLVLNPFSAQFKEYDTLQRPG